MNYEKPGKGRATINDKGYELEVIIPAKKNILLTLFLCAWLGGWAFGEIMVLKTMLPATAEVGAEFSAFTICWLIGWTIGGAVVISIVVWNLVGKEIIELSSDTLKIEHRALKVRRSRKYALSDVKNLRIIALGGGQSTFAWSRVDLWGFNGSLAFDYGMKTVKFARGIDEAEASHILELIKRRIPS